MHQFARTIAGLAVLAILAGVMSTSVAEEQDVSTKDIMNKAHKGGDSIKSKLEKDLKGDKVDWDEVTKLSKELVSLGEALSKNKPPKGEQESWDKLTKSYAESAKALLAAAEKKEKKDADAAMKKIAGSCGACHKAHKGK
jgi:cytochrome c553